MTVTDGRQLKAGRVILGLTVRDMAEAAGINRNSVLRVEAHKTLPRHAWAASQIQEALEAKGIGFDVRAGQAAILFKASQERTRSPYNRRPQAQL